MSGISKVEIKESIETLKTLLNEQKSSEMFQRIQVLYLLKSQQVKTITEVATIVGRHRVTVQGWLHCYQTGGIDALLTENKGGGRKSVIPEDIITKLTEKLQQSSEFSNYKQIQAWLARELDFEVSYDMVYYLVRKKLKLSLKSKKNKNNPSMLIFLRQLVRFTFGFAS